MSAACLCRSCLFGRAVYVERGVPYSDCAAARGVRRPRFLEDGARPCEACADYVERRGRGREDAR